MPQILTWALFGIAARWWQLGIEMRPFLARDTAWGYPVFAAVSGSFGYWLSQVDKRQTEILARRRESLLEKRKRARERDDAAAGGSTPTVAAGV
ncbi:unnamed protein product [Tuber melanosporum]|jgi:hypothetical protein|uniref:(Perigord truffle) hypothetical protein n=1 Tax=Tuber melanosporum (strain Mel28) TaxID=656061 RepID=D5G9I4_TUBMM|nr:uncharacterized protein GSTUM_00003339001 [Tuber melanosporum]CAZ81177.1 unnamed protein product [Tuber melanosporum]